MLGRHIPRSSFINLLTVYTFGLIRVAIVLVTVNAIYIYIYIYIYIMIFRVYCTFAEISTAEGEVLSAVLLGLVVCCTNWLALLALSLDI